MLPLRMNGRPAGVAAAFVCLLVAWSAGDQARLVAALLVLLVAPGFLLERALLRNAELPGVARVAIWPALSVSSLALLYQWAAAGGVSFTPLVLTVLAAGCLLAALAVWLREKRAAPVPFTRGDALWSLALAAVFGLTLWTRFAQVGGLVAPAWVDSLHHALLIRAAAEQGHAPYSLVPYLPIERLTYHSGFHSFVAAVLGVCAGPLGAWGGGTSVCDTPLRLPEAMLLLGQLLNALVVLAWAGAAAYFWRGRAAPVVAALVVGLASIMPAYYLSWGRYTLVTGMLMLPAALIATHLAVGRRGHGGALVLAALVLAGLSLVHFVALCLALLWCAALAISGGMLRLVVVRGALMGVLALLLTAPWYAMVLLQIRPGAGASAMHVAGEPGYNAMPTALLWAGSNQLLAGLAGLGALLALWRRHTVAAVIALWWALVALAANPVLVGLPYLSFFTNEFVAITLFAPLALLIAGGVVVLEKRLPNLARQAAPVLVTALGVWLATQFQSVVRSDTVLASAADLRAIQWVAQATPPDARFVVNSAPWLYAVSRGADGGWWLLPLAGRHTSTPPVVYNYGSPAYVQAVEAETSWLRSGAGTDPAALATFMREYGYGYVFATGRGASVDPARLRQAPEFEELHRDEDVSIFRLRR